MMETAIAIAVALGLRELIAFLFKRFFDKSDAAAEKKTERDVSEIDADTTAFTHYHERLLKLEDDMAAMHKELSDHRVENATLREQNKAMQKDNDSQTREIDRLRDKIGNLEKILKDRDTQLFEMKGALDIAKDRENVLTSELQHTTRELNELKMRFDALLGTDEGRRIVREAKKAAIRNEN